MDLLEGMPLTSELILKLDSIAAELTVLQSTDVQQKIEIANLKEQITEIQREKEQLKRENDDLRKTKPFTHTDLLDLEPLDNCCSSTPRTSTGYPKLAPHPGISKRSINVPIR